MLPKLTLSIAVALSLTDPIRIAVTAIALHGARKSMPTMFDSIKATAAVEVCCAEYETENTNVL